MLQLENTVLKTACKASTHLFTPADLLLSIDEKPVWVPTLTVEIVLQVRREGSGPRLAPPPEVDRVTPAAHTTCLRVEGLAHRSL